ncbi:TIR domain-containing protein [Leptolyngbya boryana CZ1]|uniref:TIR domain-containing protein n=1 Tax=Leptolyngbya boryana CZ1 TaxID=3060204 RepID=A0AA97AYS5_LEPBY|nr:TIR domain-containing protein [Leptolyngbya boryana]WNZ48686.1 TIR domain-containing protein [Leptolyngbya boryana CZ1]
MTGRKRVAELKCERLLNEFESLRADYDAVASQIAYTSDRSSKVRLERMAVQIEERLADIEQQLVELEEQYGFKPLNIEQEQKKVSDDHNQIIDWEDASINVFCSYSNSDSNYFDALASHLVILERQGVISNWYSRNIERDSGENATEVSEQLKRSQIILLLFSSDFLATNYAYGEEVNYALKKHDSRKARVIPIILRPVDWSSEPFRKLQSLPRDGKPISTWSDPDEAFVEIASTIRQIARQEKKLREPAKPELSVPEKTYSIPDNEYELYEVFKESGVPTITFVEPADFYRLKMALSHPGRGVIIEGPSGIGKTTALKEAIHQLRTSKFNNKVTILSARYPENVKQLENISSWQEGIVVIDDFHLLDRELGHSLVDRLKYYADQESVNKIVIVGIPHTRTRLVEVGYDVATRIEIISMGKTPDILVEQMIEKGELALNIRFARKAEIVSVANGSLNIAQMLCAKLAAREDIVRTQNNLKTLGCYLEEEIEETKRVMDLKYGEFIKFFSLLNGRQNHNCINLLLELSRTEEGYLSLIHAKKTHPHLLSAVEEFVSKNYIESLDKEYPKYSQFIFYDKYALALIIDDPQFIFYLKQSSPSELRSAIGMSESSQRSKIFISYSHVDSEWLKKLQVYLKPLEKMGLIERWDDTRIKTGMKWRDEIKKALDSAKIAILLVSSNFLASDFISENELPPLLKAAEDEGALIFSIILDPCKTIFSLSELEQFQTLNPPSKPISGMEQHEQGELFDKLLTDIVNTLELKT